MVKNEIDFQFPPESHAEQNTIFMDQLLVAYEQADGFIDCLEPIY